MMIMIIEIIQRKSIVWQLIGKTLEFMSLKWGTGAEVGPVSPVPTRRNEIHNYVEQLQWTSLL